MTAMMAFFLVMWLVNAADKKVLTQVASYFNPLKMSDRVTASKGVEDMVEGSSHKKKGQKGGAKSESEASTSKAEETDQKNSTEATHESKKEKAKEDEKEKAVAEEKEEKSKAVKQAAGGQTDLTEQELFNDPFGILEKLAAQAMVGKQSGAESDTGSGSDREGGQAFRDPFDPEFNRNSAAASNSPNQQQEPGTAEPLPPEIAELEGDVGPAVPDMPVGKSKATGEKEKPKDAKKEAAKPSHRHPIARTTKRQPIQSRSCKWRQPICNRKSTRHLRNLRPANAPPSRSRARQMAC